MKLTFLSIFLGLIPEAKSEYIDSAKLEQSVDINHPYETNFYIGARGGLSVFQNACTQGQQPCDNRALGFGIYAGYQFLSWFALEGALNDYGEPSAKLGGNNISATVKGAELSTKLSYPIQEQLRLYSRLGISYQNIDKDFSTANRDPQSSSDWHGLLAAGMTYQLTPNWFIRPEYQLTFNSGSGSIGHAEHHFVSLGLTYHFTEPKHSFINTNHTTRPVNNLQSKKLDPVPSDPEVDQSSTTQLQITQLFNFDSAEVIDNQDLKKFAAQLSPFNNVKITISGHTDNIGSVEYNQNLSLARAKSVADYLIQRGVPESFLMIEGLGESKPVASNATQDGRRQNRRVTVQFTSSNNID